MAAQTLVTEASLMVITPSLYILNATVNSGTLALYLSATAKSILSSPTSKKVLTISWCIQINQLTQADCKSLKYL